MKRGWLIAIVPGALVVGAGALVLTLLLVKLLWAWTVPDLFPGAVEQGLIARSISWLAALKVAIFVAVLAAVAGGAKTTQS
jgi:hypothetical protein